MSWLLNIVLYILYGLIGISAMAIIFGIVGLIINFIDEKQYQQAMRGKRRR